MAARAQRATQRLGFFCLSFPTDVFGKSLSGAFLEELGARGWNEGVNLHIDWRWYGSDLALAERQAAEFVALKPDLLLAGGNPAVEGVRHHTKMIPVVFALVSVIQNFGLRSDLHDAQTRVATLQTRLDADRRTVARDRSMLTDLTASDAKRYTVAYGTVVTRGPHLYLALAALPALPRGKVYETWTLARGAKAMAPSVTFVPNQSGITLVPLPEDATDLTAVALSVEPEGGSRQPTTKPAFVQPLS